MGRMMAWQLLQQGYRVSLFDKDSKHAGSAASFTAAGMLAPYSELESADPLIFEMGQAGLQLWPGIIDSLQAQQSFFQRGTLVVAHRQDRAELQQFNHLLQSKLPADNPVRYFNHEDLSECEPTLAAQFNQATFLADESWLHNGEILTRLAEKILEQGASWYSDTPIMALSAGEIRTADTCHHFDWVIDCRGLGAKQDIQQLRGVRGELIWVHAPDVTINTMVRLMHPRYRLYLVPQRNSHYILGATQIESDDNSPISVRSTLELLSALYSLDGGFSEARIIETKTNCRPALMNNQPLIAINDGLIRLNGLFRHGFMLAPVMAAAVLDYLAGRPAKAEFMSIYHPSITGVAN